MLGTGILKGLAVTAKNFAGSYHDPSRLVTVEYPEERIPIPENYRNFPFLVHDGGDPMATLRCVACKICEAECPPQCIYIIIEQDEKGRPTKKPKVFDIDISVCMSCQICVEVCPFDAIKMDQHFEIAADNRFGGLLLHREALAKSNEYYQQLHPTEAAGVDAILAEQKARAPASKGGGVKTAPAATGPAAATAAPAVPAPPTPVSPPPSLVNPAAAPAPAAPKPPSPAA